MPECHVCNGNDFEEHDGLFYCTECQTQSQILQTVEVDESDVPAVGALGTLREVEKKKKLHVQHWENEYDGGRPWTIHEAYQIILEAQVDALIAQGAHHSLKDAVLRLWARYLSQLGVAFTTDIKLIPENQEKLSRHREKHRGNMNNPNVKAIRTKRRWRKNHIQLQSKMQMKPVMLDDAKDDNQLSDEDEDKKLDDINSCSSWELVSDSSSSCEAESREVLKRKLSFTQKTRNKSRNKKLQSCSGTIQRKIERMTLMKTIAFLYLGLLFTSNGIMLSDIIKWVYAGIVPYLEVTQLLNPSMKLSAYDELLFRPVMLQHTALKLLTGRLAGFLNIQSLPPFPVKFIISRFILDLDLPEMHQLTLELYDHIPLELSFEPSLTLTTAIADIEAACMGYILVMLKLLFGLDDSTEKRLSEYTRQVKKYVHPDIKLFEWELWKIHVTRKFLSKTQFNFISSETSTESKVGELCRIFKTIGYEHQTYSQMHLYNRTKHKLVSHYKQENRDMLKRPLSVLLERWTQRHQRAEHLRQKEKQSFSHSTETGWCSDTQETLTASQDLISSQEHDQFRSADYIHAFDYDLSARFCKSTLLHILDPEDFLHQCLESKLKCTNETYNAFDSDCYNQAQGSIKGLNFLEGHKTLTTYASKITGSSSEIKAELKSSKRSKARSEVLDGEAYCSHRIYGAPFLASDIHPSCSAKDLIIKELLSKHVSAYEQYSFETRLRINKKVSVGDPDLTQHRACRWLISVFSHVICCTEEEVMKMVLSIEEQLRRKFSVE